MSQREGQVYVCVKEHDLWKNLYDLEIEDDWWLNAKTGKEVFGNIQGNEWYIDGNWSPEFGDGFIWFSGLGRFVYQIQEKLGRNNCVILACLTDINTDSFEWIFYACGDFPQQRTVRGLQGGPSIRDTEAWMKWAGIELKTEELRHLGGFPEMAGYVNAVSPVKRFADGSCDERRGRLFISVKDPSQWAKAKGLKLKDKSFNLPDNFTKNLSETTGTDFVLSENWHIEYGESENDFPLKSLVFKLKSRLGGKDCVIIADCADPNVSPVYRLACCVDGSLAYREVSTALEDVPINDVKAWLRLAGFLVNKKKKDYLQTFPSPVFDFTKPAGQRY